MENKIKLARQNAGLSQKEMSERFGIPIDTLRNWDCGRRMPPEWATRLLLEKLEEVKTYGKQ